MHNIDRIHNRRDKSCTFLTIPQATRHIYLHHQPYLQQTLQCPTNARLRTYTTVNEFTSKLLPWTTHQQHVLISIVRKLQEKCWTWRRLLRREKWTFIQISNSIEDGMPHTIHSAIVLPEGLVETLCVHKTSAPSYQHAVETLIHEQIHVLQKLHRPWFDKLYADWGFQRLSTVDDVGTQQAVAQLHRLLPTRTNPDTPHKWLLHGRWFLFVHLSEDAASMRDVKYYIVDIPRLQHTNAKDGSVLRHRNAHSLIPLADCGWYNAFYGHLGHCYHPDESAAVLLAMAVASDYECKAVSVGRITEPSTSDATRIAVRWLNANGSSDKTAAVSK